MWESKFQPLKLAGPSVTPRAARDESDWTGENCYSQMLICNWGYWSFHHYYHSHQSLARNTHHKTYQPQTSEKWQKEIFSDMFWGGRGGLGTTPFSMLLIDYMGCPLASIVLVINQHIIKSILWSMSPWRLLIMLYSTPMYYVCCMYYNYNNISHNLYFYSKNTKSPMGKSQQRTEFSELWQSSWSANSNYLHFWLSILKSVEEIHLRLYQSHKDPKFPGASGQSLCSRQIQIVYYS